MATLNSILAAQSGYVPSWIKTRVKKLIRVSGYGALTADSVMGQMDHWVEEHPWARGGWVQPNRLTADYIRTFPGEKVDELESPHPIQQVRSEIKELVENILKLDERKVILEIGMGIVGGSHSLWTHLFAKVVSVEHDINRVKIFIREQRPNPRQSFFIAGDSRDDYVIRQATFAADQCDVLFIDGDHTLKGVEADWRNYKDLVRSGGMIVFHDTQTDGPPEIEVHSFVTALENGSLTGKKIKMTHIRHSRCVGISFYIVD